MKTITYRIPTRQYAYIEVVEEIDNASEEQDDNIIAHYLLLEDEYKKQQLERDSIPFEDIGKSKLTVDTGAGIIEDVSCGIGKSRNEYLKK